MLPHGVVGLCGGGGGRVAALSTLAQVLSATSNGGGATIAAPGGIQAGDLIVLWDVAAGAGPSPSEVVPSLFTLAASTGLASSVRGVLSYKIAAGTEGGNNITGMSGNIGGGKALYVFRGDAPIASVTLAGVGSQATTGNPTQQTVTASAGTPPLVVLGGYGAVGSVDPRTFSPAKDGEISGNGGGSSAWLAYKLYNSSPADVNIDMDDEGFNVLASCYLACA